MKNRHEMKHYAILLILLISYLGAKGQEKWVNPVQIFTPNAESLGKYGQVPVNYFNGLPQISIPIATFKAKGYELPVSLSYYAAGNRPDSHPGWVGLGWSLSAGGSINRIINGVKDEMTKEEFNVRAQGTTGTISVSEDVGYYYNTNKLSLFSFTSADSTSLKSLFDSIVPYEMTPDEFQVNIGDISASFYFTSPNEIKIKSKSDVNFKIEVNLDIDRGYGLYFKDNELDRYNLAIDKFTYINQILLTNSDGVKYYFGGDLSSVEFSYDNFMGTANTWHIKKIEIPNGETITFNYEKDGIPIVVHDSHYFQAMHFVGSTTPIYYTNSKANTSLYMNYFFKSIQPSYLTSINSSCLNKTMYFKRSKSTELSYNINTEAFRNRVLLQNGKVEGNESSFDKLKVSFFTDKSYYMHLDTIVYNAKKISFNYTNSISTRLKLLSVSFLDQSKSLINKYQFEYNTTNLPDYNSKKTDNWGLYNNKYFDNVDYNNLCGFRSPDSNFMKAEILEKIVYPTGGYSRFYYEPHDFSKVAKQFPFILTDSVGIAGGLRIKKIETVGTDNKTEAREFLYLNKSGNSSGILSGIPLYYVKGRQHERYAYHGWDSWSYYHISNDYIYDYYIMNQQMLNQLSDTNGNHITYSRVIEKLSDDSKIIYSYSNHEKYMDEIPMAVDNINDKLPINKFISKEIERGLLDSVEYYKNNTLVKKEQLYYNDNSERYSEFVKSIGIDGVNNGKDNLKRVWEEKIYTLYPYLTSKKVFDYDSKGLNPVVNITEYGYNLNKLQSKITTYGSNNEKLTKEIKYSGDVFDPNSIYTSMKTKNILNQPIEIVTAKSGSIVNSELTTFKSNENTYVPENLFKTSFNEPIPYSAFSRFNGSNKDSHYGTEPEVEYTLYDKMGNITQIKSRYGTYITYLWGYNYLYPVAKIVRATLSEVEKEIGAITINTISSSSILTEDIYGYLQSLRSKLPNAQIYTYTYKPLVGMTSSTDPNGLTTYYDYDDFDRLKQVYRMENRVKQVLQSYDYHYQNK